MKRTRLHIVVIALFVFSIISSQVFAQTQSDSLVISQPPKVTPTQDEEEDTEYFTLTEPKKESGYKLKESKSFFEKDDKEKSYFYRRNWATAQVHYVQSENPYSEMTGYGGYIAVSQPSIVGTYYGVGLEGGRYAWNHNRSIEPEYYADWTFKGVTQSFGAHVVIQSSSKSKVANYQAGKIGFTMVEETIEGGWVDEIHYNRTDKVNSLFLGYETVFYRNDEQHVGSAVSLLVYAWFPIAQSSDLRIDGVKQETEKLDKRKFYVETEIALLSFPMFGKSAGLTVGPVGNWLHEGKATNIWGLGGQLKFFFKYNEVLKVQLKFLMDPRDKEKTNTTQFFLVNIDGFNLLKATGIIK